MSDEFRKELEDMPIADLKAAADWLREAIIFENTREKYEKLEFELNQEISRRLSKLAARM